MVLPPFAEDPEAVAALLPPPARAARPRRGASGLLRGRELSMGMSHDFEVAIEEGATMVRVGTAIFGERRPPQTRALMFVLGNVLIGLGQVALDWSSRSTCCVLDRPRDHLLGQRRSAQRHRPLPACR